MASESTPASGSMKSKFKSAGILARGAILASALAVAGCSTSTKTDDVPIHEISAHRAASLEALGMSKTSPIMIRIFKEEGILEVWKKTANGRFEIAADYPICKWSGKLGPKFAEGDRQAPEGFYSVGPGQMNPNSKYHLSFDVGFPNAFDRTHGRYGQNLMVHGACSSSGCYSMTDAQVEEIYAFARDAFRGGQKAFQIEAFPFRMTAANMARYSTDPNYEFWKMLKVGYDHFEITHVPPKVDFCGGRYVFDQRAEPGKTFDPAAACPSSTQPQELQSAYMSYQKDFEDAFSSFRSGAAAPAPAPSISGIEEAALVADWSQRRARGERVSSVPPSPTSAPEGAVAAALAPVLAKSARVARTAAVPVRHRMLAPAVLAPPAGAKRRF